MEIIRIKGRYYSQGRDITEKLVKIARRIIIRVNIDYRTPIDIALNNFLNSATWHDALLYGEIDNLEQLYNDYEIELRVQRNYTKKYFNENKVMIFEDKRGYKNDIHRRFKKRI